MCSCYDGHYCTRRNRLLWNTYRHQSCSLSAGRGVSGSRSWVDSKRLSGVQRDPAAAQRWHLWQVPASCIHQAQAVIWAGYKHVHQPGNDPWQEDAVGQPLLVQRGLPQLDSLPQSRHGRTDQEWQPLPERPQPRLRWPAGNCHHRKSKMRKACAWKLDERGWTYTRFCGYWLSICDKVPMHIH